MNLKAEDIQVLFGRFNLTDDSELYWTKRNISEIIIHQNYGGDALAYADSDIAVLMFEEAIIFTNYIQPICLPTGNMNAYDIEGTIVVYGRINSNSHIQTTPHHAQLQSISPSQCINTHENAPDTVSPHNSFCASSETRVPCRG